jgi:hypothetical protein
LQADWSIGRLRPHSGLDRLDRDAVGSARAVAAILANARVDDDALRGLGRQVALALAAALGGALLVVDEDADAGDFAQLALHGVEVGAGVEGAEARDPRVAAVALGVVSHDGDAAHALGGDLGGDLRHAHLGVRRLAAVIATAELTRIL